MQDVYEDEESIMEAQAIVDRIPFAVIGSRDVLRRSGERARVYPWGVVEVENEDHCDTVKLRQLLVRNHMEDLRDRTGEMYERWRTARMLEAGVAQDNSVFSEYESVWLPLLTLHVF
jgi:septin 7